MPASFPSSQTAHAKINLALHVTGQRDDGYHLIDSLVTFCDFGDQLLVSIGNHENDDPALTIVGPESDGLDAGSDNLVVRAIEVFRIHAAKNRVEFPTGISVLLRKQLPVSSGIGGGSADAAGALRGINQLCGNPFSRSELAAISQPIGADVAMCVMLLPSRVTGIGEKLEPVTMPPLELVLVNPRVSVSTPQVFSGLTKKDNQPLPAIPAFDAVNDLVDWLQHTRNELYEPACSLAPEIANVMKVLGASDQCLYHSMSGSGATCFGIYPTGQAAEQAENAISTSNPNWWVKSATTAAG